MTEFKHREITDLEDFPFSTGDSSMTSSSPTREQDDLLLGEFVEFVDPGEDFMLDFFDHGNLGDFEVSKKTAIRSDIQFETPAEDCSFIDYCQPFTWSTLPPELIRVVALFLGPNCILRISLVCQHFASSLLHEHLFFEFSTRPEFYRDRCFPFSRMQEFLKMKSELEDPMMMSWRAFFRCTRPACITFVSKDAQRVRVFGGAIKMIGLVNDWYVDTEFQRERLFWQYRPGEEESFDCAMIWALPNVDFRPLCKLIEYIEHHWNNRADEIPKPLPSKIEDLISDYDKRFLEIDQSLLIELIMASNYMNIKDLLDLTCAKVASMLRGKSAEQIREMFGIENDFTPEEEAKIREENKWCLES